MRLVKICWTKANSCNRSTDQGYEILLFRNDSKKEVAKKRKHHLILQRSLKACHQALAIWQQTVCLDSIEICREDGHLILSYAEDLRS